MNSIIAEMNRVSSRTNPDFLERQIDDVLWSIRNPDAPDAVDYVRDATDEDRVAAEQVCEYLLEVLTDVSASGTPALFDADRAKRSPEYADRESWSAFDARLLIFAPKAA